MYTLNYSELKVDSPPDSPGIRQNSGIPAHSCGFPLVSMYNNGYFWTLSDIDSYHWLLLVIVGHH